MAAFAPPPPYSDPPPLYSRSLSMLRALPTRDAANISHIASSTTQPLDDEPASPVISSPVHQWLGEIEIAQDGFLATVEKELANVATLKGEGQAAESSTAAVGYSHGVLPHDTRVASGWDRNSPSVGMFRDVCSTDLLFLIDTTTSMQNYIDAAKAQVRNIVDSVNDAFLGQAEVRTAIIGYKDHSDYPNIEFLDFTTSVDQVHSFLSRLRASGGSDVPEDVLGGLRQALNATWSHQTRCIIHIADAPPHGIFLQNAPIEGDSYPDPGSEPHGLTHEPILSRMIELNVNYGFLRINNSTDRMVSTFSEAYAAAFGECKLFRSNQYFSSPSKFTTTDGRIPQNSKSRASCSGLLFEEFELGTAYSALQHLVFRVVIASASRTSMRLSRKHRAGKTKAAAFMVAINEEEDTADVLVENVPPQWDRAGWLDETLEVEGLSPDIGVHSASTLNDMMSSDENIKMSLTQLTVRKRSRPFAQGAVRTASYAGTSSSTTHFVIKAFKERGKTFDHVVEDMRVQALCKAFALEFNVLTGNSTQIDFVVTTCLKGEGKADTHPDDDCISLEPYVPGEYIKYNNNRGWVNEGAEGEFNKLAQAFSHFSFERSHGEFMVTDLQGAGYTLTDPSIHTRDQERFGLNDTNLGESGFLFFFQTHKCNDVCQKLGLESNGTMFKSKVWKFRSTWPELRSTVCCSNKLCGKIIHMASAKQADRFPGFLWCNACFPQLKSSEITCMAAGHVHHRFKAYAFFLESQGQKVPRECKKHGGDSVLRVKSSRKGKGASKDIILDKGFWNKLDFARRKSPAENS